MAVQGRTVKKRCEHLRRVCITGAFRPRTGVAVLVVKTLLVVKTTEFLCGLYFYRCSSVVRGTEQLSSPRRCRGWNTTRRAPRSLIRVIFPGELERKRATGGSRPREPEPIPRSRRSLALMRVRYRDSTKKKRKKRQMRPNGPLQRLARRPC